mmetsp:Transcript_76950/g.205656  ORF Transcript_76950/g.205656 Transcript_76950/m.205656 type:complete len:282 (-) Transcript_76950:10-855(-)
MSLSGHPQMHSCPLVSAVATHFSLRLNFAEQMKAPPSRGPHLTFELRAHTLLPASSWTRSSNPSLSVEQGSRTYCEHSENVGRQRRTSLNSKSTLGSSSTVFTTSLLSRDRSWEQESVTVTMYSPTGSSTEDTASVPSSPRVSTSRSSMLIISSFPDSVVTVAKGASSCMCTWVALWSVAATNQGERFPLRSSLSMWRVMCPVLRHTTTILYASDTAKALISAGKATCSSTSQVLQLTSLMDLSSSLAHQILSASLSKKAEKTPSPLKPTACTSGVAGAAL